MKSSKLQQLEYSLVKAIDDARYWVDVCCEIDKIFGAVGTVITSLNPAQRGAWIIHSPSMYELLNKYLEEGWHLRDHRQILAPLLIKKKVVTDHDYITISEKLKVPYYTDLMYPHGVGGLIAISVETPNGLWILTIQCPKDHPGMNKKEENIVHQISKMVSLATFQAEDVSQRKFKEFISLLGESNNDIIILDPDAKILNRFDGMGCYRTNKNSKIGGYFYNLIDYAYKDEVLSVCGAPVNENRKMAFQHVINGEKILTNILQIPASIRHYYSRAKVIVYTSKTSQVNDKINQILRVQPKIKLSDFSGL